MDKSDTGQDGGGEVLVQVCIECGKEYTFDAAPPDTLKCEKCGGVVFRSFPSGEEDEARKDFRESTERDVGTEDPATDVTPGDLRDLRNL
jgi:predicted  nucleic acid-binding Zn-ribbon protein